VESALKVQCAQSHRAAVHFTLQLDQVRRATIDGLGPQG
jgi:hypothetical protein